MISVNFWSEKFDAIRRDRKCFPKVSFGGLRQLIKKTHGLARSLLFALIGDPSGNSPAS